MNAKSGGDGGQAQAEGGPALPTGARKIRVTGLSRPFWEAAAQKRLLLQYDPIAGRYQFYPRPLSLFSATRALEWREASGTGTLVAITQCHAPAKGFEDQVPYLAGIVRLDEGVKLFTRVVNADYASLAIGTRMRVCWDDSGVDPMFRFEPAEPK